MDDDAGAVRAARAFNHNNKGAAMHYIIQILAAMLIGTAIGAMLGPRNNALFFGSIITIVLGVVTIVMPSWWPLSAATVVFLIVQGMQRAPSPARA